MQSHESTPGSTHALVAIVHKLLLGQVGLHNVAVVQLEDDTLQGSFHLRAAERLCAWYSGSSAYAATWRSDVSIAFLRAAVKGTAGSCQCGCSSN